jgi:hypothetical protein
MQPLWDTYHARFVQSMDLHGPRPTPLNGSKASVVAAPTTKKRTRLEDETTATTPSPVALERRLNEMQVQLLEANERAHTLEAYTRKQEQWLDQERAEHGETYRALMALEEVTAKRVLQETIRISAEFQDQLARATAVVVEDAERKRTMEAARYEAELEAVDKEYMATKMELLKAQVQQQMTLETLATRTGELSLREDALQACEKRYDQLAHSWRQAEEIHRRELAEVNAELNQVGERYNKVASERDSLSEQLAQVTGHLKTAHEELHDACVEASRLGEELAEAKRQPAPPAPPPAAEAAVLASENLSPKLVSYINIAVGLACKIGDLQAKSKALAEHIDYHEWRMHVGKLANNKPIDSKTLTNMFKGAVIVLKTLVPIVCNLLNDAGQKNETLVKAYDALAAHAKQADAELERCKCADLRKELAAMEKEMTEAESLILEQHGTNKDLAIRVERRSALESAKIDGYSLLKDLVSAQEQRRQLHAQVQTLERSLAAARTTVEKLQTEKGDLAARLLDAEKKIPTHWAVVQHGSLQETMEDLRQLLGPLASPTCNQCTIYLAKARDADRRRALAEDAVVEEQRRLQRMDQSNKLFVEAKVKSMEHDAAEREAETKKKITKLERRLGKAEADAKEADRLREAAVKAGERVRDSATETKDQEIAEVRKIFDRKVAAKNEQIEALEREAAQATVAKYALTALDNLLVTHRFRSSPEAERFRSALQAAQLAVHSKQTALQVRGAFALLGDKLREFALWLSSDQAKDTRTEMVILQSFIDGVHKNEALLASMQVSLEARPALQLLREAWKYAVKILTTTQGA